MILNAGSSSLKFAVFDGGADAVAPTLSGKIAGIGQDPVFTARDAGGQVLDQKALGALDPSQTHENLIALLLP